VLAITAGAFLLVAWIATKALLRASLQPVTGDYWREFKALGRRRAVSMGEDSLLERVDAAAEERQPSRNMLTAYRPTL